MAHIGLTEGFPIGLPTSKMRIASGKSAAHFETHPTVFSRAGNLFLLIFGNEIRNSVQIPMLVFRSCPSALRLTFFSVNAEHFAVEI